MPRQALSSGGDPPTKGEWCYAALCCVTVTGCLSLSACSRIPRFVSSSQSRLFQQLNIGPFGTAKTRPKTPVKKPSPAFPSDVLAQTTAPHNGPDRSRYFEPILPAFPMQAHQQIDGISDSLGSLHLDPPECLLFNPTGERSWLQATFSNVPRYLFRVSTPKSRGATDRLWTKSMDATDGKRSSEQDIFARGNQAEVANMLTRHLRWWEGPEDNFVSWTSSLLFAIVYIFHLHANSTNGSSLADISLCVIDTTQFPEGVFLRDLDLISVFSTPDNRHLLLLEEWRSTARYFGEYLSQGALKIEGKCQIVSAQAMIDKGLYDLQPEFSEFARWPIENLPPWVKPVLQLRGEFDREMTGRGGISVEERDAAMNIAQLFGGCWRLPVAVNFMALRPRRRRDVRMLEAFRDFFGSRSLPCLKCVSY